MSILKKPILILISSVLITNANLSSASGAHKSSIRNFGDYAQIINPLIAAGIASQEKGIGHFGIIYGQSLALTHSIKFASSKGKWSASKRPSAAGKKDRFDGMPSGHTNSAWVAAAYTRTFSEDHKSLSIPLYFTSVITGYSRIHAKEHTAGQVIAGAALAELVTYVNSKMNWSNNYRSSNLYLGKKEVTASFQFRF